jgi:hypothetical protein
MVIALVLHVTLAFPSGHPFSPLTLRTAVAEANILWSRYGVAIDLAAAGASPGGRGVLTVVVVETPRSSAANRWRQPLGAITFGADGTPAPVIEVFLADIRCFISTARVLGAFEWQWPRTMREEILGRVLGRVMAHEIGHYVLRSPRHGSAGLMKQVQFGDAFVGLERRGFALSNAEAASVALASSAGAGR